MRGYGVLFAVIAMSAGCAASEVGQDDPVERGSGTHKFVGTTGSLIHFPQGQVVTTTLPVGPIGGSGSALPDGSYGVAAIAEIEGQLSDPEDFLYVDIGPSGYYQLTGLFDESDGYASYTYARWIDDLGLTSTELHHLGQYMTSYTSPSSPGSGGSNVDYPSFCTWDGFTGPLTHYDQTGVQRSAVDLTTGSDSRLIVVDGWTEPLTTYAWCAGGVPPGVQNLATNTRGTSDTSPTWMPFQEDQAWCYLAGAWSNDVNNNISVDVDVENHPTTPTWEVTGTQAEANVRVHGAESGSPRGMKGIDSGRSA